MSDPPPMFAEIVANLDRDVLVRHPATQQASAMIRAAAISLHQSLVRASLDRDAIADIIWSMNGQEYYALLVSERCWTPARFARWLAEAWSLLLLSLPSPVE